MSGDTEKPKNAGQFPNANQSQYRPNANKPWSIRQAVRREAARVGADGQSSAEKIAKKIVQLAIDGDIRAAEYVTDQVDGKLPQTNLNADIDRIKNMTDEEIQNEIERIDRELASLQTELADESAGQADSGEGAEGKAPEVSPAAGATEVPVP